MSHAIRYSLSVPLALLLSAPLGACTGEVTSSDEGVATVDGAALWTLDAGDGATVLFYEHAPGVVGVRVSAEADSATGADLRDRIGATASLAEAFHAVRPGEPVPAVLVAADERAAARAADPVNDTELPADGEAANTPVPVYSPDYYGDNYGAAWFLSNYCKAAPGRWCETNWGWYYSGRQQTRAVEFCVMAADFADGARMWVDRRYEKACSTVPNCTYLATQRLWDIPISPRRIECFYTSQAGQYESYAWGDKPSERIHFSVRRWF